MAAKRRRGRKISEIDHPKNPQNPSLCDFCAFSRLSSTNQPGNPIQNDRDEESARNSNAAPADVFPVSGASREGQLTDFGGGQNQKREDDGQDCAPRAAPFEKNQGEEKGQAHKRKGGPEVWFPVRPLSHFLR